MLGSAGGVVEGKGDGLAGRQFIHHGLGIFAEKEEIIDRTIYALVNEGAKILEEGIALRSVDIDIIYLSGYGFPAWRGGPMWYANTVGLKKVYDRICEFHAQHGDLWAPAPLLKKLAEEGKNFDDFVMHALDDWGGRACGCHDARPAGHNH